MLTIQEFSELLHLLYQAPLREACWQQFLDRLCVHTRAQRANFFTADAQSRIQLYESSGTEQDLQINSREYNRQHAPSDPFVPAAIRYARHHDPIRIYTDEDLLPNEGLLRTDLYQNFLRRINLRYCAIGVLELSVRRGESFSLWRDETGGPFEDFWKTNPHLVHSTPPDRPRSPAEAGHGETSA